MLYLFCRHKVADFEKWNEVFQSHAKAQQESGLHLLHLLRNTGDPNDVVILFRADDPEKAKAFTQAPEAKEAAQSSGVIGVPEIVLLED